MTDVLIRKCPRQTQKQCHVTTKAEIEVLYLQAKEHQGFLEKHQKMKKAGKDSPV